MTKSFKSAPNFWHTLTSLDILPNYKTPLRKAKMTNSFESAWHFLANHWPPYPWPAFLTCWLPSIREHTRDLTIFKEKGIPGTTINHIKRYFDVSLFKTLAKWCTLPFYEAMPLGKLFTWESTLQEWLFIKSFPNFAQHIVKIWK